MSLRISTNEPIAGSLLIGETGLGLLGSQIASSGDHGPGYAYNDLSLPADANKEICGRITAWPSAGNLFAYEDTSFVFSGAPDGSYAFQYQLYVDGVATGSPTTVNLQVGGSAAVAAAVVWAEQSDSIVAVTSVAGARTAAISWTEQPDGISLAATVAAVGGASEPDLSRVSPSRIVVFEGSGSRVVIF